MSLEDVKSNSHHVGGEVVSSVSDIAQVAQTMMPIPTGVGRVEDPLLTAKGFESNPTSVANRRVLLTTITISNLDSFGEIGTAGGIDPYALMLANRTIAREMTGFDSFRSDIQLDFEMLTPSASFGAYLVTWRPAACSANQFTTRSTTTSSIWLAPQLSHVLLECQAGSKATLIIPYHHFVDYVPTGGNYAAQHTIGHLQFWALAPVNIDTTNPAVTADIVVYGTFKNLKLVNPVRGGILQSGRSDIKKDKSVSTGLGVLSNMASASMPITGSAGAIASAGLSAASSVADALGYTRAADERMPQPYQPRPFSSVAHVDGTDSSEVLGQLAGAAVSISPETHMLGEDQSSFESLRKRWTLVKIMNWNCATALGAVLGQLPVTPMTGFSVGSAGTTTYDLTTAGYFGLPYQHWRGGMEYLIIIPVSPFHRGQLRVAWQVNASITTDTRAVEQLPGAVIDLEEQNRVLIRIGYARNEMARETKLRKNGAGSAQAEAGDVNGFLTFINQTRLVCQAGTTGTIDVKVLVFARASSTMKFGNPQHSVKFEATVNAFEERPIALARLEGGALDEDPTMEVIELVPDVDVDVAGTVFSERLESLRAMAQQFTYCGWSQCTGGGGAGADPIISISPVVQCDGTLPVTPPVSTVFPALAQWSWAAHATQCFSTVRGGVRLKILPIIKAVDTAGVIRPTAALAVRPMSHSVTTMSTLYTSTLFLGRDVSAVQTTQAVNGMEFTFPFRSHYRTYNPFCVNFDPSSGTPQAGKVIFMGVSEWPAAQIQHMLCYSAYGADVSVGHFRGVPRLAFKALPA